MSARTVPITEGDYIVVLGEASTEVYQVAIVDDGSVRAVHWLNRDTEHRIKNDQIVAVLAHGRIRPLSHGDESHEQAQTQ